MPLKKPRNPQEAKRLSLPKSGPNSAILKRAEISSSDVRENLEAMQLYIRNTFGSGQSNAEEEFTNALNEYGNFSLHILILFICTVWYITLVLVHIFTIQAENVMELRCTIPELEEHFSFQEILNISVRQRQPTISNKMSKQYCKYDVRNYAKLAADHGYDYKSIIRTIRKEVNHPPQHPCEKYVIISRYHKNALVSLRSVKMEYSFYCVDNFWSKMVFYSWLYSCVFVNAVFGIAADIYGRKKIFILTSIVHLLGYAVFAIPSKWCLLVGKFLIGFSSLACSALYVLFLETCGNKIVEWVGLLVFLSTPTSSLICFIFRYCIRYWRPAHFANMAMFLLLPLLMLYITESPRWLMFVKDRSTAWKVLQENHLRTPLISEINLDTSALPKPTVKTTLKALFQDVYRQRIIKCIILYFLESVSMYIETTELTRDVQFNTWTFYLITAISGFIITILAATLAINMGIKKIIFYMHCLLCFHNAMVLMISRQEKKYHSEIMSLLLDLHLAISQFLIQLVVFYTLELFPTPIRMTALGLCKAGYHTGAVIKTSLESVLYPKSTLTTYLPSFIATMTCALLVSLLPKITSKGLPDTFRDGLQLKDNSLDVG